MNFFIVKNLVFRTQEFMDCSSGHASDRVKPSLGLNFVIGNLDLGGFPCIIFKMKYHKSVGKIDPLTRIFFVLERQSFSLRIYSMLYI